MRSFCAHRQQFGQSMTEYIIVLAFGVMVITTGPGGDVMLRLLDVMKSNYEGYSYSLSLSEAPDYDDEATYVAALTAAGYESDDIDRLTASSVDVFSDLSPYNKDPMAQITSGVTSLQNCVRAVPTMITGGSSNCP